MSQGKVVTKKNGDILEVTVSGYVGENAGLFDLNFAGIRMVKMDLSGVSYINSVGVKNWIMWTGKFPESLVIEFHGCPSLIVNQVNMVLGFLPNNGTIESLSAPYVCEDCSREETVELLRGRDYQYASLTEAFKFQSPKVMCPKCNKQMELDGVESKFFSFLKSIRTK